MVNDESMNEFMNEWMNVRFIEPMNEHQGLHKEYWNKNYN